MVKEFGERSKRGKLLLSEALDNLGDCLFRIVQISTTAAELGGVRQTLLTLHCVFYKLRHSDIDSLVVAAPMKEQKGRAGVGERSLRGVLVLAGG